MAPFLWSFAGSKQACMYVSNNVFMFRPEMHITINIHKYREMLNVNIFAGWCVVVNGVAAEGSKNIIKLLRYARKYIIQTKAFQVHQHMRACGGVILL